MKKNVLITGGSGFIGTKLTDLMIEKGYSVSILSRKEKQNTKDISYFKWNIDQGYIDENALLNADYIIHLAGESIANKRWTDKRKEEIIQSREESIALIYDVLKEYNKKPEAFISASAIGIYGAVNGSLICNEETTPYNDFLGITCQKWEAAADRIGDFGTRVVKVRSGLVLGKNVGFLKKITPIFKFKLGAALGTGRQYMAWIHIDDLCRIYLEAIENDTLSGVYNAAIYDNTTNTVFSKTLAKVYRYPIWLPNVPSFVLQVSLGEMSKIILKGRRVSSVKIEKTGFRFQYKTLNNALKDCLQG